MALTVRHVGVLVLLSAAVLVVAGSVVGVLTSRDTFAKLHYVTPAAIVAPILVTVAVVWSEETLDVRALQLIAMVAALAVLQPVVTHATARSERIRRWGDWRARPHEEPDV